VTNNHVVAGADQIRVALFGDDRKTYPAEIVGRDPLTDSALIRLKNGPGSLLAARLGDSDALEPGDWVMAIGNPFQLGHTVTVGVISYKGRPFATTEGRFQNMLQTDASINPGNSGGPLIDVRGEVIGVNSAILSGEGNGGNIGIGFAIPINTIKELLPQLRKGVVHRGQLGVQILSAPISDDEAKNLGLPKPEGAIVSRVEPDSPADRAGLRAGDVIVEYDGRPVPDADHLTSLVVATPAGSRVPIGFYRDGRRQTSTATVEELNLEDNSQNDRRSDRGSVPGFGLSLGDVTPDVADQLGLPAGTPGAVVENVEPFTPAANGGVKRGDVILEINRHAVRSAGDATRVLGAIKSGQPAFLLLSRQGVQLFIELKKG
jgi:serine protease Do